MVYGIQVGWQLASKLSANLFPGPVCTCRRVKKKEEEEEEEEEEV